MKYYIIAGEASGDLHGSHLISEIIKQDTHATIRCWGGDLMKNAGGELIKHYKELAFMGFLEVIQNLGVIRTNLKFCKTDISKFKPDIVVFIDYPGFNLRIAKFAKQAGFRTCYYISPKVWAWKESRVQKIKKHIDQMLVIFPFEEAFYKKHNYKVSYVGNPLLDEISAFNAKKIPDFEFRKKYNLTEKPIIALLPGSRKQEIERMLPQMIVIAKQFLDYQFVIGGVTSLEEKLYKEYSNGVSLPIIYNQTYQLLSSSYAAVVTSGTATLEAALFNIPQVIVYKANAISYAIAKQLIKIKYISLVNLILNYECVTELIQGDFSEEKLKQELDLLLQEKEREKKQTQYTELRQLLGEAGASKKAVSLMLKTLY